MIKHRVERAQKDLEIQTEAARLSAEFALNAKMIKVVIVISYNMLLNWIWSKFRSPVWRIGSHHYAFPGWGKQGWALGWDVEEDKRAWGICIEGRFYQDKLVFEARDIIQMLIFTCVFPLVKKKFWGRCAPIRRTGLSHTLLSWKSTSK